MQSQLNNIVSGFPVELNLLNSCAQNSKSKQQQELIQSYINEGLNWDIFLQLARRHTLATYAYASLGNVRNVPEHVNTPHTHIRIVWTVFAEWVTRTLPSLMMRLNSEESPRLFFAPIRTGRTQRQIQRPLSPRISPNRRWSDDCSGRRR